ncbi:peptide ABC transporter substrate-binding protein [Alicyclobacillus tolerans]|nr:peptide ABC transporter substrate-binding protein [Alicyclobacillus montanus]SHJ62023.1 peptide/nickel transport system substrate-binding protein [Alicyclobacillus montanus]
MAVRKSRRAMLAVGALSTGLLLAVSGCGTSPTNSSQGAGSSSNLTPQKGGTITYALPAQTNLNWFLPITNAANDSVYNTQLVDQLYKPMLWINNDYTINWNSSIAQKIVANSQGTVYHVYLNPKWKWSDGQPVTSKDVLFTWNVIKAASASNAPSPWPFVGAGTGDIPNGVKSVVANGPYEVTFTLKKPANQQWFEYNGIIQITPMPAHAWDKYPNNMTQEIKYLGSNATNLMFDTVVDGPFEPVSATPNQEWVIKPNPNYPGHKSLVDKIIFQYEASNTAEFAALQSGNINVGYIDPTQLGEKGALTSKGYTITPEYPFGIFWTEMNMYPGAKNAPIFDKLYVRQALQMAIDNESAAKDIYKGYAQPLFGPIPPVPQTKFLDPNLQNPYPYNPTKAKQLLEQHGWKEVNGVMTKNGQQMKFTMIYASGSTSTEDQAELMKEDWAQIGVDVTLKPMPFSTFLTVTANSKNPTGWDLAFGTGWDYNGPGFYPTGGQLFKTGAPSGTGFSDPQEDKLISETHQPYPTEQQTMQNFFQYEDYTAHVLPFLWNLNIASLVVTSSNVHNVLQYLDAATAFPQMQYWWVSNSSNQS